LSLFYYKKQKMFGSDTTLAQASLIGNPLSPGPSSFSGPNIQGLLQLPREFFTHSYLLGDFLLACRKIGFRDIAKLTHNSRANQNPEPQDPMVKGQRFASIGYFSIGKSALAMQRFTCTLKL
jgi:hypothetical protein